MGAIVRKYGRNQLALGRRAAASRQLRDAKGALPRKGNRKGWSGKLRTLASSAARLTKPQCIGRGHSGADDPVANGQRDEATARASMAPKRTGAGQPGSLSGWNSFREKLIASSNNLRSARRPAGPLPNALSPYLR